MPITFSINQKGGYLVAQYQGALTDEELLNEWQAYLHNFSSIQGINQLADFSDADLSGLTATGIQALADYFIFICKKYNITSMKIAIYAHQAVSFGLSRMYEALVNETGVDIEVFQDQAKALQWLRQASR